MDDPFGKIELTINKMLGRTFHNPLGRIAFYKSGRKANLGRTSFALDVGTGRGYGALYLAKRFGCRVVGIDISPTMIAEARKLVKNASSTFKRTSLAQFRARTKFDLICCFDVVGFITGRPGIYRNVHALLKKGGLFSFSDYVYTRKTAAVKKLIARWKLKSTSTETIMRRDLRRAGFAIERWEETTPTYHRYWEKILRRLIAQERAITAAVGARHVAQYRAGTEAIIQATGEGSFGHVFCIARKA